MEDHSSILPPIENMLKLTNNDFHNALELSGTGVEKINQIMNFHINIK